MLGVVPVGLLLLLSLSEWAATRRGGLWRRTKLPLFARLRFWGASPAETCAFCRDSLEEDPHTACPDCQAVYHTDCARELDGGCGTVGCSSRQQRVRLKNPQKKGGPIRTA